MTRQVRPRPVVPEPQLDSDLLLLRNSPLFDHRWYQAATSGDGPRDAAVRHYLRKGHLIDASPHPLFVPDFYRAQFSDDDRPEFPFLHLVQGEGIRGKSPSPLVDATAYLTEFPAAAEHPQGILGHLQDQLNSGRRVWSPSWLPADAGSLDAWVRARGAEFVLRRDLVKRPTTKRPKFPESAPPQPRDATGPRVSIVMVGTADASANERMVSSVKAQDHRNWELLVVHDDRTRDAVECLAPHERMWVVEQSRPGFAAALNEGLERASGEWIAWIGNGARWKPHHLRRAIAHAAQAGTAATCAGVEIQPGKQLAGLKRSANAPTKFAVAPITQATLAAAQRVVSSSLVVSASLARSVGGFDETLPNASFHDFVVRIAQRQEIPLVPAITVAVEEAVSTKARSAYYGKERPTTDHTEIDTWRDVVLNRHLIDWESVAQRPVIPGLVTIIMATYADWSLTTRAVETVVAAGGSRPIQVIVVDNGCDREAAAVLDSLPLRFPQVQIVHNATNHGFALGNNLALPHADGEILVFLNNDTEVYKSWLDPLVDPLEDPEILGTQSLLLYPSGSIQAAGVVFPECGGIPSPFLQGFPREDAAGIDLFEFRTVSAAVLAVRREDFIALRGFDPLFRNGMEDVDFGLRMSQLRQGRFSVRTESVVVHHESRTPGRWKHALTNRKLLLDRWGSNMPGDDVEVWDRVGYTAVRHTIASSAGGHRRLDAPTAVLVRRGQRAQVTEHPPQLRWAIKNPAPAHEAGEHWGDTAFARHLSASLRRLNQNVVIDNRDEFARATGEYDDVTLLLRGLTSYQPAYGPVNLIWLISHPESFHRREAEAADLVFAASSQWARRKSAEWDLRIEPLLQATDPNMFHPDRAEPDTGHRILFVGGSRRVQRPVVLEAAGADLPLTVYGPDWQGLLPDRFVKATSFPNDDLGAAYRAAGIVLNDHWEIMRSDGFFSNRLFDAVAAGARVISDPVDGIEDLFGRSVQVAHEEGDVIRLASHPDPDSVFGDDEERRRAAARIHAEHSFDVRAQALLEGALRVRATRSAATRRQAGKSLPQLSQLPPETLNHAARAPVSPTGGAE